MYVSLSAVSRGNRASIDGVDKSERHCEQKLMSCIFYIYIFFSIAHFFIGREAEGVKKNLLINPNISFVSFRERHAIIFVYTQPIFRGKSGM